METVRYNRRVSCKLVSSSSFDFSPFAALSLVQTDTLWLLCGVPSVTRATTFALSIQSYIFRRMSPLSHLEKAGQSTHPRCANQNNFVLSFLTSSVPHTSSSMASKMFLKLSPLNVTAPHILRPFATDTSIATPAFLPSFFFTVP